MILLDKIRHSIISFFEPLSDIKMLKDYQICDNLIYKRDFEGLLELLESIKKVEERKQDRNEEVVPTMGELHNTIELVKQYIEKL